ncbi:GPI transamidase component PIG-S-like protein [Citrus sinensis]|nr:GPI transamidase component PIG-S-like protein [Citrus sinensis]
MSEISPEVPDNRQAAPSHVDPDSTRITKPGVKRLVLTLSVLFSLVLGFPFLWKSVEIYRSSLPFGEISEMESNPSLSFPCRFQAVFINFNSNPSPNHLQLSILDKIRKLTSNTSQCGACANDLALSVTVDSVSSCAQTHPTDKSNYYRCGAISAVDFDIGNDDDDGVDELLGSALGVKNVYSVVVVNGGGEGIRAVVGKYRHAWIVGSVEEEEESVLVSRVAEIFVKMFVNGGTENGLIHGEFMPVGADGRIVLSFNLLNAEPNDWVYDWDFQRIDETLLAPIIKVLGPIANISVESQVLYHTPKSSFSYWDEKWKSYIFSTKDLPFFMWGGVVVWNPPGCLNSETNHPSRHTMSREDLQAVFEVFMGQFRQLFGLKSNNLYIGASGTYHLLPSGKGFTEWELDVLSRQFACFNLHSCSTTLGSLSRLVQSLPRMIIMDEIGKLVQFSLEAAKLSQSNASLGDNESSAVSSGQARSLAEDAFFHPSIMSISYYSFEHCFAIYSPFFLPVSMHVLLAALREWKRYKQEKAKYTAWKAKVKVES